MFSTIGSLILLKRSLGVVVAVTAFLMAEMSQLVPQKVEQPAVQQSVQANNGVVRMETVPIQETVAPEQETTEEGEAVATESAEASSEKESIPAKEPNQILKELEFSEEGFNWQKDWWKYLVLAIASLLILYYGIRITKMIIRLIVFLVCVGAGVLGAICLEPLLSPWLSPRMPEGLTSFMTSQHAGYALGFLICYLVATLIISFLTRKMRVSSKSEKPDS